MPNDRKATLRRTLNLLFALAEADEGLGYPRIQKIIGQERRSAERILKILRDYFTIEELVSDDGVKRFRIPDRLPAFAVRPLPAELAALSRQADAAARQGNPQAALLRSLADKCRQWRSDRQWSSVAPDLEALEHSVRVHVGPGPDSPDQDRWLGPIYHCIMAGTCLEFDYSTGGHEPPSPRSVSCWGLLFGPITYLVGKAPGRDPVLYRLDRMDGVTASGQSAEPNDGFDLDAWLSQSFSIWREQSSDIRLWFAPSASAKVRNWRFHPQQRIEELEDGSVRVSFCAGGLREIAEHLFLFAGEVTIEAPEELRDVMRERLTLALHSL